MQFLEYFQVSEREGDVGIEVEVEGRNLPKYIPTYWRVEADHSLRGQDNAEYILRSPVTAKMVPKVLNYLTRKFSKEGAEADLETHRTSVHVHINVQRMNIKQIYNFMLCYLILEECLLSFCGEDRKGYCFCLSAKDAEYLINQLENIAHNQRWIDFSGSRLRYSSMNVNSLSTFGSLEFRGMRGTIEEPILNVWVEALLNIREASKQFEDPRDLINSFSGLSLRDFVEKLLGSHSGLVLEVDNWERSVREGLWRVQQIGYSPDWDAIEV